MALAAQLNSYLNTHYDGMSPEQLILMLFKGAQERLKLVKQGIEEKNIQKRGENLSKVIAIISELNRSVDPTMKDDSTLFLRGLYTEMLTQLPMVSLNNDIQIITRTELYISKLRDIWETDVMGKGRRTPAPTRPKPMAISSSGNGYAQGNAPSRLGSISV
ncbi:flagellar export chaperone FliS [Desulfobacula sp.]|uniref:flagellar export chaperone FliS n=1 Tax=Desulfobacula sp. TaxID=2593537 RepID=UPI00261640C4|nr:flagellar export chaperone FliS [Desulfobacula sp.]